MPEMELKLVFDEADLARLRTLPGLRDKLAGAQPARSHAIYFDTPEKYLWKRGLALRVRRTGDVSIQTIKQVGCALLERGEWERRINWDPSDAPPRPDGTMIDETPFADVIDKAVRARLRPTFEVDVQRVAFMVTEGNAAIEVAIDRGRIKSAGAERETLPVSELELELKRGDKQELFTLARELTAHAPLHLSLISKAERGRRLVDGLWGHPAKASSPRLEADMTGEQAFSAICRACLNDFMLNAAVLTSKSSPDPVEAIHQGRIALRSLRAALALFKPMARDDAFARMNDELRRLARLFGEARDRDIMLANAPETSRAASAAAANDFSTWLEHRRLAAREAAREAVQSERWRIFLIDFSEWIDCGAWRRRPSGHHLEPVAQFIRRRLKKRLAALLREARDLAELDAGAQHAVRIAAKKLRYMAQFFVGVSGVADRKRMKRLLGGLDKLQSCLGVLHDDEASLTAARIDIGLWRAEVGDVGPLALEAAARWTTPKEDGKKWLEQALEAYSEVAEAEPF
ncbi:CHAD domain containing protein [Methylocella tundrae]|uniref:CHAD domain containing protein n=1 Tax=Methylocella tundrae TaxID=227605 RepID=A0A4U8YYK9_METTU|nr:CYTH and CHAD domain-containing protein [Methylocella tundrae]VFU08656.1 CHAD domain containing protein [Methylocella tundrae]